jgi:hypothetical protein
MAIIRNSTKSNEVINNNELNRKDYELILLLIGEASFKVKDIQQIYDLIIKLQKLHGITN